MWRVARVLTEQTIQIEGDRIVAVSPGYLKDEGAQVIDLSDATVMPGFMDMHVHLGQELNPPGSYSEGFYMNSADIALRVDGLCPPHPRGGVYHRARSGCPR